MKYLDDLTLPIYYVSGPPAMFAAMQKTLGDAGEKTTSNLRAEEFSGYSLKERTKEKTT